MNKYNIDKGYNETLENKNLKVLYVGDTLNDIVTNKEKLKTMSEKALTKAAYNVENRIYNEIKLLKGE